MKKKIISLALALFVCAALSASLMCAVSAEDESVSVYVTISNGSLVLTHASVTVTDTDEDGALTINDALTAAHDAYYEGGADAGYASETGDYGLSLTKLWGVENGGSYGYYVNNASAWSLADTVSEGDYIVAFVYTDLTSWSDTYSFFDTDSADVTTSDEVTLTLSYIGYDESWNTVTLPLAGAAITVDGESTEYVTDENGQVTLTLNAEGEHIISAVSDAVTLVPPVCVVSVAAAAVTAPQTGFSTCVLAAVAIASFAAVVLTSAKRRDA